MRNDLIATIETFDVVGKIAPSGLRCRFFRLSDSIGLKVYNDPRERDKSYDMQGSMYLDGFAPAVGNSFDFTDSNGISWYAYTSEIAETIVDTTGGNRGCDGRYVEDQFEDRDDYYTLRAEIAELNDYINKAGYYHCDVHPGNYGILNGRVVLIDCGAVQWNT